MKKFIVAILALVISTGSMTSQVADMGIIPVGVTLNSILRLNITGGGNLEYSVNTMDHYQNGIAPNLAYITTFTVASSVHFSVDLYADNATFTGVSGGGNSMDVRNLGYLVDENSAIASDGTEWDLPDNLQFVTNVANRIVNGSALAGYDSAGDITQNDFELNWELATPAVIAAVGGGFTNLLDQNLSSDRYVVNIILELIPTP